jgi:2-dehydro-3-deoxyphosphogluconate aldolase/(4S)-4-hydroxy-2-oxoglutarate aldolase
MNIDEVRARIHEIGIIPGVRTASAEDAHFAADAVAGAGIPIVEITMTIPGAIDMIAYLTKHIPGVLVGAGTVLDAEIARKCIDAGAGFLTGPCLDLPVIEVAKKQNIAMLAGALTPSEIHAAWDAGADFIKVFPCSALGGPSYIRALKGPFPKIPLLAAGGVNQQNAGDFILSGAAALGIGSELVPREAIEKRRAAQIQELARRFLRLVTAARARLAPLSDEVERRRVARRSDAVR